MPMEVMERISTFDMLILKGDQIAVSDIKSNILIMMQKI